jgi:hypothetical protein
MMKAHLHLLCAEARVGSITIWPDGHVNSVYVSISNAKPRKVRASSASVGNTKPFKRGLYISHELSPKTSDSQKTNTGVRIEIEDRQFSVPINRAVTVHPVVTDIVP